MVTVNFKKVEFLAACFVALNLLPTSLACSSDGSSKSIADTFRPIPFESIAPAQLNFSAGDIISCRISLVSSHILLASSNTTVIHAAEFGRVGASTAVVAEQDFIEVAKDMFTSCQVLTEWYDKKVNSSCHSGKRYTQRSVDEAIRLARNSVERYQNMDTPYNVFSCNCEHWVASWKYGIAWTLQLGLLGHFQNIYASRECDATGHRSCPPKID